MHRPGGVVAQVAKGLFFAFDVEIVPPIPGGKACHLSRLENLVGLMAYHLWRDD
jgi:hypothetical protein